MKNRAIAIGMSKFCQTHTHHLASSCEPRSVSPVSTLFPTLLNEWSMDKVKEVVRVEIDEETAELLCSQGIDGKALQYLDDDQNLKKFKLDHVQYLRLKGLVDKLKREMEMAREEQKWEMEMAREEQMREMEMAIEEKKREMDRENKRKDDDLKRESKRKDDEEKRAERRRQEDLKRDQKRREMKTIFVIVENGEYKKSNREICISSQEEFAKFFGDQTYKHCLSKMRKDGILKYVSKFSDLESGEQYILQTGPILELENRVLELQNIIRNREHNFEQTVIR